MISRNSKHLIKAFAVCTGFFSLAACKENSITKSGLVPDVDNINTFAKSTNDLDISFSHSVLENMIMSNFAYDHNANAAPLNAIAIGAYTDPFFGKTKAIAHFQMTPYSGSFKFPAGAILDSAVLVLPYTVGSTSGTYYGDTLSTNTWNVYKNETVLAKSNVYYSNDTFTLGTQVGTATINYNDFKASKITAYPTTEDTTYGQLRIKLNNSFAQEMFNTDSTNYQSTTAFQTFFKGLSIAPDLTKSQNLLAYFLLPTTTSNEQKSLNYARVEFHYHTAEDTTFSSIVVRPSVCAYFSEVKHDYSSYPAQNMLNRTTDSILLQSTPGLRTDVTIGGLLDIPVSVVNKAEMVFTTQIPPNSTGPLDYFKYLYLDLVVPVIVTDNGTEIPLYERIDNNGSANDAGITMVDPYVKEVTIASEKYRQFRINIPRTIQQYVLERKDKVTIRLKGPNYNPGMYRILANGINGNDDMKFQFNIIYTKK